MNKYNVFNLRTTFEDNFYVLEDSYGEEITLIQYLPAYKNLYLRTC